MKKRYSEHKHTSHRRHKHHHAKKHHERCHRRHQLQHEHEHERVHHDRRSHKSQSSGSAAVYEDHDEILCFDADDDTFEIRDRDPGRPSRNNMYGSLFATYLAPLTIEGSLFDCIMDTGSSDTAVAASSDAGCVVYYDASKCTGVELSVSYGEGNWSGNACTSSQVHFGRFHMGEDYTFAGMKQQIEMLECDQYHEQNCIIGLAYPVLLGPPEDYTKPFFDVLADHNDLPKVFSMQW